jgi:hypothetical protein
MKLFIKCEVNMLQRWEESQIYRGIDEIMLNLRHIPTDDVAYFLVKFNPKLAEQLATAIEQRIYDENEGKNHG